MPAETNIDNQMKQNNPMKAAWRSLALATLALGFGLTSNVSAEPPGKGAPGAGVYNHAGTEEQIKGMKTGSRYALVCTSCKSMTIETVKDAASLEALCHNGGKVHCSSCKEKATVEYFGPSGKGAPHQNIRYVNAEGKECMFVVPLKD